MIYCLQKNEKEGGNKAVRLQLIIPALLIMAFLKQAQRNEIFVLIAKLTSLSDILKTQAKSS